METIILVAIMMPIITMSVIARDLDKMYEKNIKELERAIELVRKENIELAKSLKE